MPEETNNLGMIAISIGIAVIMIIFMTIILQQIRDDTGIVPDESNFLGRNQTVSWVANNTNIPAVERMGGNVKVYNNATEVAAGGEGHGNWTFGEAGLTIVNATPSGRIGTQSEWVTSDINFSYDYLFGSAARNATSKGILAQTTFASFMPIVALAAAGALIIGIALRYFLRRREE